LPDGKMARATRAVSWGIGGIAWGCNDIDLLLRVGSLVIFTLFRLFYHLPSSTSTSFRQQGQKMNRTPTLYGYDIVAPILRIMYQLAASDAVLQTSDFQEWVYADTGECSVPLPHMLLSVPRIQQ
jgi:hypothetical protein